MTPILIRAAEAVFLTATLASPYANSNVELVVGVLLFALAGFLMAFVGLSIGRIARPTMPHPEKGTVYECGEPTIGEGWVQFDLRFYTVALVFIVFDVELALLWPWAVVFKDMSGPAFWAFFVFFLLIAVPFLYEWRSGYLDWVRASTGQRRSSVLEWEDEAAGNSGPGSPPSPDAQESRSQVDDQRTGPKLPEEAVS